MRGDECMDKSCGGLRTDEFPYFQNPVQPMECFTADLANMDRHRYRSVKPGAQARVPRKPISANRGLNLANRGIHFVPRLDPVPESMINLNLGIN